MGEYAEMMLDGTLCECCGMIIESGLPSGFPRYCSDQCAKDRGAFHMVSDVGGYAKRKRPSGGKPKPCVCGDCGKQFKSKGARRHHRRRIHPSPSAPVASS